MTCRFNPFLVVRLALLTAANMSSSSADTVTNLSLLGTAESMERTIADLTKT
jgi:hypothetical protein